nr:hypothetical protein [Tanacetum cinerariifolium]
ERIPKKEQNRIKTGQKEKRGEAGKSQKQLQSVEEVKLKKMRKEGPEMQIIQSLLEERKPSDTPVCYLCTCEQCGNILSYGTCLNCNSGTENSFTYDLIPESFDEVQIIPDPPPQFHFNIYLCQIRESNSHYGYECSQRVSLVYEPKPCYIQNFSDNDYSHDLPGVDPLIDHHCCYKCGNSLNDFFCHQCTCEFCRNGAHKLQEKRIKEEPEAKAQNSKIPVCYDDDDDYNSAITPNEPVDSLSIGDEHLNTIPAMESDEFIKSSVENLVTNPSESEGENGCDMPACFTTFSNVLFDAEYEFDSVDDQSCSDEDFPKKIFSNPLFEEEIISMKIDQHHFNAESDLTESLLNHDSSIIPSSLKIDSLLDEFIGELTLLKLIPPGIDETDCYREEEIHLTKRLFDSFMEEIDLSCTPDDPMPPSIEEDDYDSERDILIRKELLDNYSLSQPVIESYHFDIPSFSHPPAKLPDGNTGILNIKMMGDISKQKEKSPDLLSHQGLEIFQPSAKFSMMIHGKNIPILDVPLFHFYPLDQLKYGGIGSSSAT